MALSNAINQTSMSVKRHNYLLFAMSYVTLCCLQISYGQEFAVEGRLDFKVRSSDTDPGVMTVYGFTLNAKDTAYKLKIWKQGDSKNYHEYFHDAKGNEMYKIQHLAVVAASANRSASSNDIAVHPVVIEERDIPPNDGSRAQFIWFALASHHYFRNFTNHLMPPIWQPDDPTTRTPPFKFLTFVDLFTNSPALPRFARFINDGYYRSYNPATRSVDIRALLPSYDKGYTNAYYTVLATTNTLKNELPLDFVFVVYSTPHGPKPPFERFVAKGTLTRVSDSVSEPMVPPMFSGVGGVRDYRVKGQASLPITIK